LSFIFRVIERNCARQARRAACHLMSIKVPILVARQGVGCQGVGVSRGVDRQCTQAVRARLDRSWRSLRLAPRLRRRLMLGGADETHPFPAWQTQHAPAIERADPAFKRMMSSEWNHVSLVAGLVPAVCAFVLPGFDAMPATSASQFPQAPTHKQQWPISSATAAAAHRQD
jgi:hypothetical protein